MRGCLSENEVLELLVAGLPAAERERIEQHIDECESCRALLVEAARGTADESGLEPTEAASSTGGSLPSMGRFLSELESRLPPGTLLAERFEIRRRLGQGGAGVVYAARDQLLDEDVALKVLHPWLRKDDAQAKRLRAEVVVARRVAHPNVCRVHDLCWGDDLVFLVMELVEGPTLRRRLRHLSLTEGLEVLRQLGAGLVAAHRAGVVHCDVKPENAILERDRVVLTDFGIAKEVRHHRRNPVRSSGSLEGTPPYMAPEQILCEPVDERTDVYGLCAVAFELLTHAPPFGSSQDTSPDELAERILSGEPRFPEGALATMGSAGRRAVAAVLRRGLARQPAARYESVDALVTALVAAVGLGGAWGSSGTVPPAARGPRRTAARASAVAGARRIATVVHVLAEAMGEDEESEELAADRAAAVLGAAQATLIDAGATVVGQGPREVIAVFGATSSAGDEPVRAAASARAVIAAAPDGEGVRARVGIATGRLLVRPRGGTPTVAGAALGTAAALASAAAPGEVRVSPRTGRHLRRRFELEAVAGGDVLRITGKRPLADVAQSLAVPLLGREREVTTVVDTLAGVTRSRQPGAALVLGPPGIGKSRLRREVWDVLAARGGFAAAQASPEPQETLSSYAPLRSLLRQVLGLGEETSTEEIRRAAGEILEEGTLADALTRLLAERPADGMGSDGQPMPTLGAVRAALAKVAGSRNLLLVLDDAHWADDATLDLVEALARGELEAPIATLVLARPDLLDRRPHLRQAFRVCLQLHPLEAGHAEELAALLLGPQLDAAEARAVAEASEGNPFFVEELAGRLLERTEAAPVTAPPQTIEEVIQARLDQLSPEARELLRAAALLGRSFRRADLGRVLLVDGESVDALLADLEGRGLLFPLPPDASTDDRYVFKHSLLCEVAYQELPQQKRRRLHAEAVRVLRERSGGAGDDSTHWVDLARHLEGSDDTEAAIAAYRRAGDLAGARGALADARECYRRAHTLAGPAAAPDLLLDLGEASAQTGALAQAQSLLDEAVSRTEGEPGFRALAARALHARANLAKLRGEWDDAVALARRGLALVSDEGEPVLAARLHGVLGWVLGYILGDNIAGLPESRRAVEILSSGDDPVELARAYSSLGANYMRAGQYRDQLACNRRSLELSEAAGSLELQARAHLNLGVNLLNLGELDGSLEHSRRAIELAERISATTFASVARNNLAMALVDSGRLEEAEGEVAEALRLAQLCGGSYFDDEAQLTTARIAAKRGNLAEARARAESALALATQSGARISEGISRRYLGAILSQAGEHAAAERELAAAEETLRDADIAELARVFAEQSRALARRGDLDAASRRRAEAQARLQDLDAALDLTKLDDLSWI